MFKFVKEIDFRSMIKITALHKMWNLFLMTLLRIVKDFFGELGKQFWLPVLNQMCQAKKKKKEKEQKA